MLEERCCICDRGLLLGIAGLALCESLTVLVRLLIGVAVVNVELVERAAGLVPVEYVALGPQVPVEGLGVVCLIPVEGAVDLVPVEGSVGLIPVEGVEGLVQSEPPDEAISGLTMVEGVAGLVVGSSLTAHCRRSVGGSRVDGRRWTLQRKFESSVMCPQRSNLCSVEFLLRSC